MSAPPEGAKGGRTRWSRYAETALGPGAIRTTFDSWTYQQVSLGHLLTHRPPPARVISIGCGIGLFDILLAGWGYQVTGIDSDPAVLEAAEELGRTFGIDRDLRQGDAFDLSEHHGRYDVAYSAGLVEHWDGERTAELIAEHARCAPLVQVEVPTRHTLVLPDAMPEVLADAHLYRPSEFVSRVNEAGLSVVKVYPLGSVPGRAREIVENLMPPVLFRRLQLWTGHSMGVGVIARGPSGG
jgi:SAM-dependent methyltransferase